MNVARKRLALKELSRVVHIIRIVRGQTWIPVRDPQQGTNQDEATQCDTRPSGHAQVLKEILREDDA
jgi:hypothetical protein